MGSIRNQFERKVSEGQILAIQAHSSYEIDVNGSLPNCGKGYKSIEEEGFNSMKSDGTLMLRVHYASGGTSGLPQGCGVWLDESGITRQ